MGTGRRAALHFYFYNVWEEGGRVLVEGGVPPAARKERVCSLGAGLCIVQGLAAVRVLWRRKGLGKGGSARAEALVAVRQRFQPTPLPSPRPALDASLLVLSLALPGSLYVPLVPPLFACP